MKHLIWISLALLAFACTQPAKQHDDQAEHAHAEPAEEAAAEAAAMEGENAYPADSVGEDGRSFHGFRIDESEALPLAELSTMLAETDEVPAVKVSGEINEACQMKGCWMTMSLADGSNMRVRFKDYGFFVPKDCAGKTAVMEGKAFLDTTSVDMLRHYAVDGGMTEEEAEAKYTEPEVAIAFEATGVIIK